MPASPRRAKAVRETSTNPVRSALAMLAITLGVIGVGSVGSAYVVLRREMAAAYAGTHPASATLWLDRVDDALVEQVRRTPGIAAAEARRTVLARVRVGADDWRPLLLFVIRDFAAVAIDRFEPERGARVPGRGEILFERVAPRVAPAAIGDELTVALPPGPAHTLRLSGTVHAPGLAPAWMEHTAYGFIGVETLGDLGAAPASLDELKILVAAGGNDVSHVRAVVRDLSGRLDRAGQPVRRVEIRPPGRHPHAAQLDTLLFLLQAFGLLSLLLSAVLVASIVTGLLAQQVRQIGVMKAVGGTTAQIAGIYLSVVAWLACTATVPGLLVANTVAWLYARLASSMLNFDLASLAVPVPVLLAEAALGLLVPLLVACWPIWRGTRVTVRAALDDHGASVVGRARPGRSWGALPGVVRYALRNVVRRRARAALMVGLLAAGGTIFLSAANIGAAMDAMVAARFAAQPYDLLIRLARPVPLARLEQVVGEQAGVARVEGWRAARGWRVDAQGDPGNAFELLGPPVGGRLAGRPELVAGRWLRSGDERAFVVNQVLFASERDWRVGEQVQLAIDGQSPRAWTLVGVVQEQMAPPLAYAPFAALGATGPEGTLARVAVVATVEHGSAATAAAARALERVLPQAGLSIAGMVRMVDFRAAIEDHLLIIARLLLAMAALVVAVGGLGLISTMGVAVLERTRELGVLRAIGAGGRDVLGVVVLEGLVLAGASWILAAGLPLPVSAYLSRVFGQVFFESPLACTPSLTGLVAWLGLILAFAAGACLYPARQAARMPLARALTYE